MKPMNWVGMLGVGAMALLLSPTWAAAFDTGAQGATAGTLVIVAGVVEFKTSPNVRASYSSDSAAAADGSGTTYVAGSVHMAGDRAYGVDPDYTGMFVQNVTVGDWEATLGTLPAPTPGSNSDFTGDWVAK